MFIALSVFVIRACSNAKADKQYDITAALGKSNIVPLAIIGSGPGGGSAALYGARANVRTLVVVGSKPGGLLTETSWVENWPGTKRILGPDIPGNLRIQAEDFGAEFLEDVVERVDFSQWPFELQTEEGRTIYALSVIIATGAAPRVLGVPGEKEYWGRGVTACAVCDAPFYKGEEVVVIGGGDSAVEEAMQLSNYADKITILVRKGQLRAAASMQDRLKDYPKIAIRYNVEIREIVGDEDRVTGVKLFDTTSHHEFIFPTTGVFLAIGHDPSTAIFKGQLELLPSGHIKLDGRSQATSIPGVFAAGDVADDTYRQAGVAAGDGIKAALDALAFLNEVGFNQQIAEKLTMFEGDATQVQGIVQRITTIAEFKREVEEKEGLVLVDFYADYCSSCMQMLPIYESVAQQYVNKVSCIKVDVDQASDLAKKLFVYKVPCMLVYNNGNLVARYHNPMNKKEFIEFVESFLAGNEHQEIALT